MHLWAHLPGVKWLEMLETIFEMAATGSRHQERIDQRGIYWIVTSNGGAAEFSPWGNSATAADRIRQWRGEK